MAYGKGGRHDGVRGKPTLLMVAEKPSIAASIASALGGRSGGKATMHVFET